MSPKYNFVRKLESYFNERYDEFTIQRIERFIKEYEEEVEDMRAQAQEKIDRMRRIKEERLMKKKEKKLENEKESI